MSKELLCPTLTSANALTIKELLECIVHAHFPAFIEHNVCFAWKKTGIWPFSKEYVLNGVINLQPLTPLYNEAAGETEFFRTPVCAQEVNFLINSFLDRLDLTPWNLQRVIKLNKAAKQGRVDCIVADQEIGELKETADRQERRKEKLPGPEGLILGVNETCKLAAELRQKQEGRDLVERRRKGRMRKLGELIRDGILKREAKKLLKRFYDEVVAELGAGASTRTFGLTEGPTNSHDAIGIEHLD